VKKTLLTLLLVGLLTGTSFAEWKLEKSSDPMTDEKSTVAYIVTDSEDGMIVVRCDNEELGSYFSSFNQHYVNEYRQLHFRVDSGEVQETKAWGDSPMIVTPQGAFVDGIMEGKDTIKVQTTDYFDETMVVVFPLDGANTAVGEVLKACGLK